MLAAQNVHARRTPHRELGLLRMRRLIAQHRHRADQDRAVVEQPVRPAELEKGVGKQDDEPDRLGLEHPARRRGVERQVGQHGEYAVGGAQQCKAAADRHQRARREKSRALLQPGHDAGVDHPQLAPRHGMHPGFALRVHRLRERFPLAPACHRRRARIGPRRRRRKLRRMRRRRQAAGIRSLRDHSVGVGTGQARGSQASKRFASHVVRRHMTRRASALCRLQVMPGRVAGSGRPK